MTKMKESTHNVTPHNKDERVILLFQSVWNKKMCLIYIHCYDGDVYLNNIVTMCANLKNAKLNVGVLFLVFFATLLYEIFINK